MKAELEKYEALFAAFATWAIENYGQGEAEAFLERLSDRETGEEELAQELDNFASDPFTGEVDPSAVDFLILLGYDTETPLSSEGWNLVVASLSSKINWAN